MIKIPTNPGQLYRAMIADTLEDSFHSFRAVVTTSLHLKIVFYDNIHVRIVQSLNGSFCIGNGEVTPSLLSEVD